MSGKVPQIVVKRPVFTRNVNENEIDFVIKTTVNPPIFDKIVSEISFQFSSGWSTNEIKVKHHSWIRSNKIEKKYVRKEIHLDTMSLRDTLT